VALKIYTRDEDSKREWDIYKQLPRSSKHPGREHVRDALDMFILHRSIGYHYCLVLTPLWESLFDLHAIMPDRQMKVDILKSAIRQVLKALDYLHTECRLVHTGMRLFTTSRKNPANCSVGDIKPGNIMQVLNDDSVLDGFVQAELEHPSPRKFVGDRVIYLSRLFEPPKKFNRVLLCDFGSAVQGDEQRSHNAQPELFKSPEVMLEVNWSYPTDI
jgi:serine/threonine protein kinase